jgi:hypothetical protein
MIYEVHEWLWGQELAMFGILVTMSLVTAVFVVTLSYVLSSGKE